MKQLKHNYQNLIQELIVSGRIFDEPGLNEAWIQHDDDCGVNRDAFCNCKPNIVVDGKMLVRNGKIIKPKRRAKHRRPIP